MSPQTAIAVTPVIMERRTLPSRPLRLGTRRRRLPKASAVSEAGVSRSREPRAPSLDTEKQLATSAANWLDSQLTEMDYRAQQWSLHKQLVRTVDKIRTRWTNKPADDGEARWWAAYEAARKPLKDETVSELWKRVEKWLKENKAKGRNAEILKWERLYAQLNRCQREWIGYRAACCGERTRAIAVPIGCNHRLCPVCAWHRAQTARIQLKKMYDRYKHPVFLTLTVPNLKARTVAGEDAPTLDKHYYHMFRYRVRALLKQYDGFIKGGVYSIETTYNRREKEWHVHAHILADACSSLPSKDQKIDLCGWNTYAFQAIKLRMEFDWLRLWRGDCGKELRANAKPMDVEGDRYDFEKWIAKGRACAVKEYRGGRWIPLALPAAELMRRTAWNERYRRVVDLRPVIDRDGAAKEVLKYITKCADFCDDPDAVEEFCDAVKSARLIQTFGTFYGIKFDTDFDTDHLDDWGERRCACGTNAWERMGVLYRDDVVMDPSGRWYVGPHLDHRCRGTVPRPTIRALEPEPEERDISQLWTMQLR